MDRQVDRQKVTYYLLFLLLLLLCSSFLPHLLHHHCYLGRLFCMFGERGERSRVASGTSTHQKIWCHCKYRLKIQLSSLIEKEISYLYIIIIYYIYTTAVTVNLLSLLLHQYRGKETYSHSSSSTTYYCQYLYHLYHHFYHM